MTFILDTDVVSHMRRKRPDPSVRTWLDAADPSWLHIASITVSELCFGLALAKRRSLANVAELAAWVPAVVAASSVLHFDAETAEWLGSPWAEPSLRHVLTASPLAKRIRTGGDLFVAATALRHHAVSAPHCAGLRASKPFTGAALP